MKYREALESMMASLAAQPAVRITSRTLRPGVPAAELAELEDGLEVRFAPALRAFFAQVGGASFGWSVDPAALPAELSDLDPGYLTGAVSILDPFTMVMGKRGQRWKDELYFDHMSDAQKAAFRAFVPFDHTGELAPGFVINGGVVGPAMKLFDANQGLLDFAYDLESYIARVCETRGFSGWPAFWEDTYSDERDRYDRAATVLFRG